MGHLKTKMAIPCYGLRKYDGDILEKDLIEFYERAREATKEALEECNAKLASSIQDWGCSRFSDSIQLSPLTLKFDNVDVEREYSRVLCNKKDLISFGADFIIRIILLWRVLSLLQAKDRVIQDDSLLSLHLSYLSVRLISYLWIVIVSVSTIIIHFRHPSWYVGYRNTVLFVAYSLAYFGEELVILSSHLASSLDFFLVLAQSILLSVLYQVPFCLHLKTRVVGFVLQIFGILVGAVNVDNQRAMLYLSMGHSFGVVLAYFLDQQPRIGFLQSVPRSMQNRMLEDSKIYCLGFPRRALGGFAGGFAGVSSLKCSSSPSLWRTSCM